MDDHRISDQDEDFLMKIKTAFQCIAALLVLMALMVSTLVWLIYYPHQETTLQAKAGKGIETYQAANSIVGGKDQESGLIAEGDYMIVKTTCTVCHSSNLILNAKLSRPTWIDKIRWMQAKQKLWDLGANEKPILDYLAKYYGPDSVTVAFRKPPLKDIKWYTLKD